jgi:hypothetical protein
LRSSLYASCPLLDRSDTCVGIRGVCGAVIAVSIASWVVLQALLLPACTVWDEAVEVVLLLTEGLY